MTHPAKSKVQANPVEVIPEEEMPSGMAVRTSQNSGIEMTHQNSVNSSPAKIVQNRAVLSRKSNSFAYESPIKFGTAGKTSSMSRGGGGAKMSQTGITMLSSTRMPMVEDFV